MKTNEFGQIVIDKDEYVVNTLANGIAVQMLVQATGFTMEYWSHYLTQKAEEQLQEIKRTRPEQIDQMIGIYEKASSPDEAT